MNGFDDEGKEKCGGGDWDGDGGDGDSDDDVVVVNDMVQINNRPPRKVRVQQVMAWFAQMGGTTSPRLYPNGLPIRFQPRPPWRRPSGTVKDEAVRNKAWELPILPKGEDEMRVAGVRLMTHVSRGIAQGEGGRERKARMEAGRGCVLTHIWNISIPPF